MKLNSNKKLKVFHRFVNYDTQAGFFTKGLREKGLDALSVTGPDRFKRITDIGLSNGGNIIQKILMYSY